MCFKIQHINYNVAVKFGTTEIDENNTVAAENV